MNLQRRRKMRHSSWTLFLVPLALPLVLMAVPGSLKQVNRSPAGAGEAVELVQEAAAPSLSLSAATSGSGDDAPSEESESLFQD